MPQPLSCSLPCLSRTHGSSPRSSWEITSGLDPGIPAHGKGSPFVCTISTSTLTAPPPPRPAGGLTHGDHIPIGLHHHVSVEATLGGAQTVPLILGEEHSHVLEGHLGLEQQGGCRLDSQSMSQTRRVQAGWGMDGGVTGRGHSVQNAVMLKMPPGPWEWEDARMAGAPQRPLGYSPEAPLVAAGAGPLPSSGPWHV